MVSAMQAEETARRTDEQLAALHERSEKASAGIASRLDALHWQVEGRPAGSRGGRRIWRLSRAEVIAEARALVAAGQDNSLSHGAGSLARRLSEIESLEDEQARIAAQIRKLNEVYVASPWQRYFPCLASGGHIHSSLACSTCRPDTRMGWTPQLSGKPVADAVAELGPVLCSVCFPSAPVQWRQDTPAAKPRCKGSGAFVPGRGRSVRCPECGRAGTRTPNGLIRSHEPEESR